MTADPIPTRRLSPTPAWLIFGLLVVEGLLWLSERYQWFWFNERKGWTVLIAVAVVGVAMLVMLGWFIVALIFRWRFHSRFGRCWCWSCVAIRAVGWRGDEAGEAAEEIQSK